MNYIKEKILTQDIVRELGLDKVAVITGDMLDGYTHIGHCAFYNCSGLKDINIPNNVTSIRNFAFSHCTGLTSVTIGNSVTSIGNYAFSGCNGLTEELVIPNGVTSIGEYVFSGCNSLTSVVIPNSVTTIGNFAFENCAGLASVTIPNSVTSIGKRAFRDRTNLVSVTIGDKTYEKQVIVSGKCKAYKGFNADMTCRGFQYEEGKTYEFEGELGLCKCGFHACLNLVGVFNYYYSEIGKEFVIHEVELEGVSDERNEYDSKVVAGKITIGKRIL